MGKWEEKKLSEVYDVRDGTHDSPKYVSEGYPLVTSKNLKNNSIDLSNVKYISQEDYDSINRRSNVEIGDILFAMIGTIGNPVLIEQESNYAIKNVALFKKKDLEQDPKFLTYYLGFEKTLDKMISEAKGATQKFVGLTYLRNFKIPLPPLPEQQRIVAKLDGLFAKIDKAIGLLEANILHTQALMGSVLDAEFGKLDCKSFILKSISEKIQYGYTGKTKEKGKYYYLRITDIQDSKVDFDKAPFSDISDEEAPKYVLNQGDILFARTGATAGKSYLFNDKEPSIFASYLIRVVLKQDILSPNYLKWYFQSDGYWTQIFGNIVGAAQPNFNGKKLGELNIPVPSLEIQNNCVVKFEEYDKVIRSSINTQTQKLNHLKALKSSLLDQAFKGEL